MDPMLVVASIGITGFGIYVVRMGVLMIVDKKYRRHVVDLWLNPEKKTKNEEKTEDVHVRFIRGPLFILGGSFLIYLGISSLI
jgi:hypothetical protein